MQNIKYPNLVDRVRLGEAKNHEEAVQQFLQEKVDEEYGGDWNDTRFRREALGEWARDDNRFIFKLNERSFIEREYQLDGMGRLLYTDINGDVLRDPGGKPRMPGDIRIVIGIDLGFKDESAYVVIGYSQETGCVYHLYEDAESGMTLEGISDKAREMIDRWDPERVVVDWATGGDFLIKGLNQRYDLPVIRAEKREKASNLRLLNSDLRRGRSKVIVDSVLADQLRNAEWADDYKTEKTYHGKDNARMHDRMDAFLYAWREAYHWVEAEPAPEKKEENEDKRSMSVMLSRKLKQVERENAGEREYATTGGPWMADGDLEYELSGLVGHSESPWNSEV